MEVGDWITLAAVIVALSLGLSSLIYTKRLQKRERRNRLLNEIIDWAIDCAKPTYALTLTSVDYTLCEKDQTSILQLNQASYTHILIVRGNYIGKIALIFTQDLSNAVENVRKNLEDHSKLINDWMESKTTAVEIGIHEYQIGQFADAVLEEVVKITTRDIS